MTQRYPAVLPDITPANPNYAKPRYGTAGDWAVGVVYGTNPGRPSTPPTPVHKATYALADAADSGLNPDYTPRSQNARLISGQVAAEDVLRPVGTISPLGPYPAAGDTPAAAPVVTSIAPSTAASGAAAVPLVVTITGTGFTPWSRVVTGGGSPWDESAQFVSATKMLVTIDPRAAVPGTASVAVIDHSVLSNVDKVFTFT